MIEDFSRVIPLQNRLRDLYKLTPALSTLHVRIGTRRVLLMIEVLEEFDHSEPYPGLRALLSAYDNRFGRPDDIPANQSHCRAVGCPVSRIMPEESYKRWYCDFHNDRQTYEQESYVSKRLRTDLKHIVRAYHLMTAQPLNYLLCPDLMPDSKSKAFLITMMDMHPYQPDQPGTVYNQFFDVICSHIGQRSNIN